MKLIIIAAVAENGCIGKEGKIPWHFSEDFRHFKNVTLGHTVVMGRRTFESIGNKSLPGRKNVILSSSLPEYSHKDLTTTGDFKDILKLNGNIYVCGGSRLYKEAFPVADEIIITHVPGKYDGDAFFPVWPLTPPWREFSRRDGDKKYGLTYKTYRNHSPKV